MLDGEWHPFPGHIEWVSVSGLFLHYGRLPLGLFDLEGNGQNQGLAQPERMDQYTNVLHSQIFKV